MNVLPVTGVSAVTPTSGLLSASAPTGAASTSGAGFDAVVSGIDALQKSQSTTDSLAVQAVTGDLDDVHDYTIAAAQTQTEMQLTAAVRNKAVDAFNEIMRMTV